MNLAERLANLSPERRRLLERLARPVPISASGAREAPASFEQERLWFLQQLEPDNTSYHLHMQLELPGDLDPSLYTAAWQYVLERHEALRTRFVERGGVPVQLIDDPGPGTLALTDLSQLPNDQRRAIAMGMARKQVETPFDLSQGTLLRIALLHMPDKWVQLLTVHHIVADGMSIDILMRDLNAAYSALVRRSPVDLPPLEVQFGDFARWQRSRLTGEHLESLLAFWRRYLEGAPELLLPMDRPRPAVSSHRSGTLARLVPTPLRARLYALAAQEGATVFQVLVAAFAVLLHRHTGQDDFVLGTPIANRDVPEVEDLIGFFLNTIVLRVRLAPGQSFTEVLRAARQSSVDAYSGQQLPFARLVQHLQPQRHLGRNPLYQATIQFLRSRHESARTIPLLDEIGYRPSGLNVDLALDLFESGEGILSRFEYNRDLFEVATIEHLLGHWERVLEAVTAAPDQAIETLRLTTADEDTILLHQWCGHPRAPKSGWMFQGVGVGTALVSEREELTYAALDRLCGQLATVLRQSGATDERVVAIQLADSMETVIAILACWRAGAAFAYLDPTLPAPRVQTMLEDLQPAVVLTDAGWWRQALASAEVLLATSIPATRLAAVIYTSGSTGVPKGVMIEHGALANQVQWLRDSMALAADDVVLQKYGFGFDAALSEMLAALSAGAALVLAPARGRDVDELVALIRIHGVTVLDGVPALFDVLLDHADFPQCNSLRLVISGGERLSAALLGRLAHALPQARIINAYGPTETTITATAWRWAPTMEGDAAPPIGRPIPGNCAYVLDSGLHPVPIGMPGELHIGGAGVARGYWNDNALTQRRFVPNPFGPGRLFATGDLVRFRPDGELSFLGRLDQQVKIRGHRVELEEIEQVLARHPSVSSAAVAVLSAISKADWHLLHWRLQQLSSPEAEFLYRFETEHDHIRSQTMWRNTQDFDLYLHIQHPEFVATAQPNQRNWVLQRMLDETVDDLKALDSIARRCIASSSRPEIVQAWSESQAEYSEEELVIAGQQVMQDWERPLMEALAAATTASGGDVAEIGFGMGISADYLQQRSPESHTIVECHPDVLATLHAWRAGRPEARIRVVEQRWQDWCVSPESFNGVMFDTYPTTEEEYIADVTSTPTYAASFFPMARRILRPGGVFTYYTNEIDSLSRRHQRLLLEHFSSFRVSLVRGLAPPAGCQYWWADTMAVVAATK